MKRRTRKRTRARRGLVHVSEALATLVAEIDADEAAKTGSSQHVEAAVCSAIGIAPAGVDSQDTFSFYQPLDI